MTSGTPEDPTSDETRARWGLGDVVLGFVAAQITSVLVYSIVISGSRYSLDPPSGIGAAFGEVAGRLGAGAAPGITEPIPLWLTALLQVPLWAGLLAIPILATRFKGSGPVRDLGLAFRWIDVPVGLVIGVASQLVMVPVVYWILFRFTGERDVSEAARTLTDRAGSPVGVLLLMMIVGIGAPVAEEVFFRGLLQRSLLKRGMDWRWALVVTALVFAISHFQSLQFPALFIFGLILGSMTFRTGRLGPAMVTHLAFNITAATMLVVGST